jgi:uncharacterized CHY-type Zn-finger protein
VERRGTALAAYRCDTALQRHASKPKVIRVFQLLAKLPGICRHELIRILPTQAKQNG